ncbi:helix-turn-helix domain-containing protein [Slackia piriformis]|uniref:helix-turn-helix domain-containing protein n=1 Tax=Slackia piriformis TaxID=626934 RepID=UPI0032BF4428
MKSADAIRLILEEQGRSQRSLALELGLTPQALDQRLKSKTMKVETLCQTADQLGYTVALVPKNDGRSITIER